MALNSNDMAEAIVNSLIGVINYREAMAAYLSAIKSYLETNLDIVGTYSGTVSGQPDPASGDYRLPLRLVSSFTRGTPILTFLENLSTADPNGFLTVLMECTGGSTVAMDNPIAMTAPIVIATIATVDLETLKSAGNPLDCWKIYSRAICDSFRTLTFPPAATTSSGGGIGTTTLTSVA
jgi:hypothetical protein